MKRGGPLTRRTPLQRGWELRRVPMRRRHVRRDWTAATTTEACRACGLTPADPRVARIERAHVLGRAKDTRQPDGSRRVEPHSTVPLCIRWREAGCHTRYDQHDLNLRPHLTEAEWAAAVARARTSRHPSPAPRVGTLLPRVRSGSTGGGTQPGG